MRYIDYAKKAVHATMNKYREDQLPPAKTLHYHQGVFLNGVIDLYEETGDEKYYRYVKNYLDLCIREDGLLSVFNNFSFDDIQALTLLFPVMEKGGKLEKYERALITGMSLIKNWPRDPEGGFWHKNYLMNEMWLDGIYMVSQLQMLYANEYNEPQFADNVYEQFFLMYNRLKTKNDLLYHAYSYEKNVSWCDKETGCSSEVWARSLGWYTLAAVDVLELTVGEEFAERKAKLSEIVNKILKSVCQYQDEKSGMWYQIADKGDMEDNWLESSGSSLFVYSVAKAVRLGVLEAEYLENAKRGFEGIINKSVVIEGENFTLNDVCPGTGVGTYDEYIERPKSSNDLHGMGPFVMMCVELEKN